MMPEKEFEILKEKVIRNSIQHIRLLKNFSHQDLKDFDKRMHLLDAYIELVTANTEFRIFILITNNSKTNLK